MRGWALKGPDGRLVRDTFGHTKHDSIDRAMDAQQLLRLPWATLSDLRKLGYRIVRVEVREVK